MEIARGGGKTMELFPWLGCISDTKTGGNGGKCRIKVLEKECKIK